VECVKAPWRPGGGQRPVLARIAVIGVIAVLAACGSGTTTRATKAKKPKRPVPSSTTTTTRPPINYAVKRGDTLTALARFFGVPLAVLAQANHLDRQAQLTVGQMLVIPSRPPIQLTVTPADAPAGGTFQLTLTGAQPGETVTFEIDRQGGGKFTGPPHTAAADGTVTATYQSGLSDAAGTFLVVARGNQGASAEAALRVDPAPST
jgi:LysM repeat protein